MGNILDIVFLIILGYSVFSGFHNGFVFAFVEFVGGLLALAASWALSNLVTDLVYSMILKVHAVTQIEYIFLKLISTVILFIALQSLAHLCAGALDTVFHLPLLHQVNVLLGGVFGLFKGAVAVVLVCMLLQLAMPLVKEESFRVKGQQMCADSRIYRYVYIYNPLSSLLGTAKILNQSVKIKF